MQFWTRKRVLGWRPWPALAQGLAELIDYPDVEILLYTDDPHEERELIVSTLRLIRKLAEKTRDIVVASPHPCADFVDLFASYGGTRFWVVERLNGLRGEPLKNPIDVGPAVCPHLHAKTEEGKALTVCGCHHDAMVLSRRHMVRWCLANDRRCPHRTSGESVD